MASAHAGPTLVLEGADASFLAGLVPLLRAKQRNDGLRLSLSQEHLVTELERLGRAYRMASDVIGPIGRGSIGHETRVDDMTETPCRVSTAAAAGLICRSERHVVRLLAVSELTGRKVAGKWQVDIDSIAEYLEQRNSTR